MKEQTIHLVYNKGTDGLEKVLVDGKEFKHVTAVELRHSKAAQTLIIELCAYPFKIVRTTEEPKPTYEQLVGRGARIAGPHVLRVEPIMTDQESWKSKRAIFAAGFRDAIEYMREGGSVYSIHAGRIDRAFTAYQNKEEAKGASAYFDVNGSAGAPDLETVDFEPKTQEEIDNVTMAGARLMSGDVTMRPYQETIAKFIAKGGSVFKVRKGLGKSFIRARADTLIACKIPIPETLEELAAKIMSECPGAVSYQYPRSEFKT